MTVEQGNGQGAQTPGWWRMDLAGGIPGLDVFPFCSSCGQLVTSGYMRGSGMGRLVGQLYLCDVCAGALVVVAAEAKGLEILDRRTDVILDVSRHDVTVTVIWTKGDDLAATEVLVWPAGAPLSPEQEADLVELAAERLRHWLASYRAAMRDDQPATEVVGQ